MPSIKPIQAPGTARPAGHYSQAIVHDGLVFVSGQLPADLATGTARPGPIEAEAELALGNLRRVLEAAGSGLDRLLSVTIYITDIELWGAVNGVYARVMGDHRPARAIVPVGDLHFDTKIEIQAIAALGSRRRAAAGRSRGKKAARRPTRRTTSRRRR